MYQDSNMEQLVMNKGTNRPQEVSHDFTLAPKKRKLPGVVSFVMHARDHSSEEGNFQDFQE